MNWLRALAVAALARGGLPQSTGAPPDLKRFTIQLTQVLLGTAASLALLIVLVSGFSVLPGFAKGVTLIPESTIEPLLERVRNSTAAVLRSKTVG